MGAGVQVCGGGQKGCATPLRVLVVPLAFRSTVQVVTLEKAALLTPGSRNSKGGGRPADAAVLVALPAWCRREQPHRRGGMGELEWLLCPVWRSASPSPS